MAGREQKVLEERVGRRLADTQVLLTKEVVLWNHGYLAMPQVRPTRPFLISQTSIYLQFVRVYKRACVCARHISHCSSACARLKLFAVKCPRLSVIWNISGGAT